MAEAVRSVTETRRYVLEGKLRDGRDASIWSAREEPSGTRVCIKASKTANQVQREREVLQKLQHPSIIKVIDHWKTRSSHMSVLPLGEASVIDWIVDRGRIEEPIVRNIIYNMLEALAFIHEHGYWHCDVKPDNILIMKFPFTGRDCVLCDFGFAGPLAPGARGPNSMGSLEYRSPEQVHNDKECDHACDIWSLGMTMFTCLTGHWPFSSEDPAAIEREIGRGVPEWQVDENLLLVSEEAFNLLAWMLEVVPARRITARDALRHSWFAKGVAGSGTTTFDGDSVVV
jgi:serine/threonine protein kinase